MRSIETGSNNTDFSAPQAIQQPDFLGVPATDAISASRPNIFRRGALAIGTSIAALGVACGGGDSESAVTSTPFVEPTPTSGQTVIIVRQSPTPEPTSTPEPIRTPTPEPEKILTVNEITTLVKSSLVGYEGNIAAQEALGYISQGEAIFNTTDPNVAQGIANTYGSAAKALIKLACETPGNKDMADAVNSLKSFSLNFMRTWEQRGDVFASGATQRYEQRSFAIPNNCLNTFLTPPPISK